MILILFILSAASSYAWFSLTRNPRVGNLSMYINSYPGLEIAVDPTNNSWSQQIKYEDLVGGDYELIPATWSEKDQRFYGAVYSFDGRRIDKWEPLTDERHSNSESRENYYIKGTFYARTGADVDVSLAEAIAADEEKSALSGTYLIPAPEWNEETLYHDNAGKGGEVAVRIGLRVTRLNEDLSVNANEEVLFYIYEPNAERHIDGSYGYVNTPSIDGTEALIGENKLIKQTPSIWGENYPVERDNLVYFPGEFESDTNLFSMKKNETVKIEVYIWLEGQDVDCTNAIESGKILANIQFDAVASGGSGLVPIPPEE